CRIAIEQRGLEGWPPHQQLPAHAEPVSAVTGENEQHGTSSVSRARHFVLYAMRRTAQARNEPLPVTPHDGNAPVEMGAVDCFGPTHVVHLAFGRRPNPIR